MCCFPNIIPRLKHNLFPARLGWDFSSRWFETDNMTTVRTSNIVPVDLNTILALVEDTLGRLAKIRTCLVRPKK